MKKLMMKVLFDNGTDREYEIEQREKLTDDEFLEAIETYKELLSEGFKNDKSGSFTLTYGKDRFITMDFKKITLIDIFIQ